MAASGLRDEIGDAVAVDVASREAKIRIEQPFAFLGLT
jgi:hypothetical protein